MRWSMACCLILAAIILFGAQWPQPVAESEDYYWTWVYLPLVARYPTPTRTPWPTSTRTPIPSCNGSEQLIRNGSFEDGLRGWATTGSPITDYATTTEGRYSLVLGGYANAHDAVQQQVALPSWTNSVLVSFDMNMQGKWTDDSWDWIHVKLLASSGETLVEYRYSDYWSARQGWQTERIKQSDASKYASKDATLVLSADNDEHLYHTVFRFDRVQVLACH